jgi:signal transduction histidine kinase
VSEASRKEALGPLGSERSRPAPLPEAGEGGVPLIPTQSQQAGGRSGPRGKLFRKYVALFVAVVCVALITNGAFEIGFSYQDHKTSLVRIQREQAEAAAAKVGQFIKEIESQVGWTTQLPWSADTFEQRRSDALRLLHQVPAVNELSLLDASGKEQLRVSRLAMDVVGSNLDLSRDPKFTEAVAHKVYYGPVYFRRESEPYMTLTLAGTGRENGVSVAEVSLKLIWDVVSQIKVGERGDAYVVDREGRLIAHPDISLVLRNTDMSQLAQVKAARQRAENGAQAEPVNDARDILGRDVLAAYAPVNPLGWLLFVELPVAEAYAPLYDSVKRTGAVLLAALGLALLAGLLLTRRMVGPIRMLSAGAARIGGGDFSQRITITTGDELEALADQFNEMGSRLQESYADLEQKVELRTRELAQSVEELRALGEVSQAVNSTLDPAAVLSTIVAKAVQLSDTEAGAIYVYDDVTARFELRATQGMSDALIAAIAAEIDLGDSTVSQAVARREPIQIADVAAEPRTKVLDLIVDAGFRSLLGVPLLGPDRILGALVVRRRQQGLFPKAAVDLMQTFAAQSVAAIQNARLFSEIEEKGRQLALASQHKSQFLANMSHELRTPLNAILGYTELMQDSVYGEVPGKMRDVLDRVQSNSRHLLGLINDVLDLSKIEAGQITLSLASYSLDDVVHSVVTSVEPLAAEKGLDLKLDVGPNLPVGRGDGRRIAQVLLNLVGNAIKFTDQGEVAISASAMNGAFNIAVRDTGPGIPVSEQVKIFEEFHQADNSATKTKGGTGLGLAIAKRIIEMHGGRISVESAPGAGATFSVSLPVNVKAQLEPT